MTARIHSIEFLPRGADGWTTGLFTLGETFTALIAPNGAGKTPLLKGLMAALGHTVEHAPQILQHCEAARSVISSAGKEAVLTRSLESEFRLTVSHDGKEEEFGNEAAFSKWLHAFLGVTPPSLTAKAQKETPLYWSVIYPMFWVHQDGGWNQAYVTPASLDFVIDQRQEVLRFLLGLPPRHPFRSRDDYDDARRSLAKTEKLLEMQRFIVDRLRRNLDADPSEANALAARRDELRRELRANESALEAIRSVANVYERDISVMETSRAELRSSTAALNGRREQLELALAQVDGETEVLTANVQASEVFRQFCDRDDCRLFSASEESYGRALLFLRDQLKDLRTADGLIEMELANLARRTDLIEADLVAKRAQREKAILESPHSNVAGKIEALTKELVGLELKLARIDQWKAETENKTRLVERHQQESLRVAELKPRSSGKRDETLANDARRLLSTKFEEWLRTLKTPNVKGACFDEDFEPVVDDERFSKESHHSGSTRTRIVLAYHATVLEAAVDLGGNHPGWLILDAPKQHELHQEDLDAYFGRLRDVAARHPGKVQVVFSAKDLTIPLKDNDIQWAPAFKNGAGEPRFFGPRPPPAPDPPAKSEPGA